MVPSFMVKAVLPFAYTPPPFLAVALLPAMVPSFMVNVPENAYTPPPLLAAVLPVMLPPFMVTSGALFMYTPPPLPLVAVFSEITALPDMMNSFRA